MGGVQCACAYRNTATHKLDAGRKLFQVPPYALLRSISYIFTALPSSLIAPKCLSRNR
jgi:hypothetical protein